MKNRLVLKGMDAADEGVVIDWQSFDFAQDFKLVKRQLAIVYMSVAVNFIQTVSGSLVQ